VHNEITGECHSCGELHGIGCTECNSSQCTVCNDNACCGEGKQIITIPNGKQAECGSCSEFDENCTSCTSTFCTGCKEGMYADENTHKCFACSNLFANCGECSATKCTKCIGSNPAQWVLTPNGCVENSTYKSSSSSLSSSPQQESSKPVIASSSVTEPDSSNTGMIVGIVVGCLALVFIVVIAFVCVRSMRKNRGNVAPEAYEEESSSESTSVSMAVL